MDDRSYKIRPYAGNSEYPTVPKGENLLVRTISRKDSQNQML